MIHPIATAATLCLLLLALAIIADSFVRALDYRRAIRVRLDSIGKESNK